MPPSASSSRKLTPAVNEHKLEKLFPFTQKNTRTQLRLDTVGAYSATDQKTARSISERLLRFVSKDTKAVNATASIGGDTMVLARDFGHVVSIEQDADRFGMLVHNIATMNLRDKVTPIRANSVQYLLDMRRAGHPALEMVYMDPPWGGPEYKHASRIPSLSMSGMEISDIVSAFSAEGVTKHIAFKLPNNLDFVSLLLRVCTRDRAELLLFERFPKMTLVVFKLLLLCHSGGRRSSTHRTNTTPRS